jgi:hypothetical protein
MIALAVGKWPSSGMEMRRAILFSQMEPPPASDEDFNDWYNSEHIPIRLALRGMELARRYTALAGTPKYLAIYEAADLGLFDSPGYHAVRKNPSERTRRMLNEVAGFTRFICAEISDTGPANDGRYLSVNAFAVPENAVAEFNDWYESEHIPRLLRVPGWLRVRRYLVTDGEGAAWTHFALHELADPEAMNSPARAFARSGEKRARLVGKPWFDQSGRWLYRRIYEKKK